MHATLVYALTRLTVFSKLSFYKGEIMRLNLWVVAGVLVGSGCAQTEKNNVEHSNIKPPAPVIKATDHHEPTTPAKAAPVATKIECSVKDDIRILDLREKGNGCELAYTKAGQEGIVASSGNNGLSYCENTFEKIKARLVGAGFQCN
jgi:hypothetical protein